MVTAGAEIYAAPNRATIIGKLTPLTEVRVVRDDGAVQLVAVDGITVGFVRSILLTEERRVLGDLALESLTAIVSPDNGPSIALIEKLGLVFDRMITMPGDDEAIRLYRTQPGEE